MPSALNTAWHFHGPDVSQRYPVELAKIGDHIRKRRLDLGLLQVEIAAMIGVTESTVWNWERGTEPELIHIPAVFEFIGYVPWELPEKPVARLAHFKKVNELSFERLGDLMGRNPEQLSDWLSGRNVPIERNQRMITEFLEGQDTDNEL